jgi:hypothetical protein
VCAQNAQWPKHPVDEKTGFQTHIN